MTWTEDATMSEDKQCLQRDTTAVVAARETSRKSCDFKAADAIRHDLKAQYVQQAPIAK